MSHDPDQLRTAAEDAAWKEGLRLRALMASPEYRAGDPLVHAQVTAGFRRAYGSGPAVDRAGRPVVSPFARG